MYWKLALMLSLLFAAPALAPSASAQSRSEGGPRPPAEGGPFSVQAGLGFTADPDAFLLEFEGNYRLGDGLSVGPLLQLGLDDDFTLVSPSGYVRYTFDLSHVTAPELRRLQPYVQGGLGFTYIDDDDDDDIGFLISFGFGADYPITDSVSLGSRMLFNFLPDDVVDENFYFSWQVVGVRYRF